MKSEREKKIAAAMAAVGTYLQQEEESFHYAVAAAMAPPVEQPVQAPAIAASPWAQSGRQNQMQLRNLMQMKAFHRF
jgi:hypothetical protein